MKKLLARVLSVLLVVPALLAIAPVPAQAQIDLNQIKDYVYTVGLSGSGADYEVHGTAEDEINAALADCAGATDCDEVRVLEGQFEIADIIQLPSETDLVGAGIDRTTIKAEDAYNPSTLIYGASGHRVMVIGLDSDPISDVTVSGITWDGNVQNIPGLTSNSGHRIIWVENATNFRLENNKFINSINWTVYFNLCNQLWIENNIVLAGYSNTYNQNDGIHTRDSVNFVIRNNYVDTTAGGGTSGDDAIVVGTRTGSTSDMAFGVVSGNIIPASGSRGIIAHIEGARSIHDIVFSDNVISNTLHAGIKLYTENSQTGRFYGITVANNEMYNIGTNGSDGGSFIRLQRDFGTARALYENISIVGNTMRTQNAASSTWYAMDVSGRGTDLVISDNSLDGVSGVGGIKVGETSNSVINLVMVGNKINVTDAASNARGIYLSGVSNSQIIANNINGHTTGTTYGVYLEGNSTDNSIADNVSHNFFASLDNGISEVNGGNNPTANQFFGNNFNTVTTKITTLGTSSMVFGQDAANFGFGLGNPVAYFHVSPPAQSGGPAATSGTTFRLDGVTFTDSATSGSGTATGYVANSFSAPTLAAANSSVTTTNASTVYIGGAPVKGTNNTASNSTALYIAAGAVGAQSVATGLVVNAPTGATNNFAAAFIGGRVGIGTTTPNNTLEIRDANAGAQLTMLKLRNNSASTGTAGSIDFNMNSGDQGADPTARITGIRNSSGNGDLTFSTRNGSGTLTEYLRLDTNGHLISGGTAPAASSCGTTPSVAATSTDTAGKVTIGTGSTTSCTVTFNAAYASPPACTVSGDNTAVTYIATTSSSVLTIASSADMASDVISYICIGHT